MAKQPQDAVQFTYESAERIADVVRAVETTPQQSRALTFGKSPPPSKVKLVRAATFSGEWNQNTPKIVKFSNAPTSTVTVRNLTMVLPLPFTATQNCIVGKEGTAWYLVSAPQQNTRLGLFEAPWTKGTGKSVTIVNDAKQSTGITVTAYNRWVDISGTGTKQCVVSWLGTSWVVITAECDA